MPQQRNNTFGFWAGIAFTLVIAGIGTELSGLPVVNRIGPMLASILLAVLYRNFVGYPEPLRKGIQFSGQRILRLAIILFGFKLNVDVILHKGLTLLVHDVITIVLAIAATMLIARLIKAEEKMSLLLGIGTGVCGAAAVAAVSPIIEANEEDTAISVGIIALMGTIFALAYAALRPYLPLSPEMYGIWTGISLHEIAHVAAAAGPAGQNALAVALLAKLGRVFLLIPLSFVLSWWARRRGGQSTQRAPFPWFLVGFVITSLIGTYLPIPKVLLTEVSTAASFLLAAAMVGLGLNVHLSHLRSRALRPLAAMAVASVILSVVSYLTLGL
ncbi:MAG: YeiH family protein [Symbiobacteriia bacterium]